MAKRGRTDPTQIRARYLAEANILADNPDISDIEMVEALKKRGIYTTRQTVHADRQKDIESMTLSDIKEAKSNLLAELDTLINIAYTRAKSGEPDALRAMNEYNKLVTTKAKVITMFEQAQLAKQASERPVINIKIGKPVSYKKENEKDEETN